MCKYKYKCLYLKMYVQYSSSTSTKYNKTGCKLEHAGRSIEG